MHGLCHEHASRPNVMSGNAGKGEGSRVDHDRREQDCGSGTDGAKRVHV